MPLTAQTLVRCGVPAAKARAHLPHIASAMREHEITTQLRARMFISQVMHESAALRYFEEIASGAAYEGRRDLGNVRPGDGRRYKGRGPIQLTGRSNYTLFGKLLGLDLVGHPELAATPRVGWRVAALYFQRRGCNAAADRRDFAGVTRLINGGLNGYDDRLRYYKLLSGVPVVPGEAYLGRGDRGDAVVTMTRRLSFVRGKKTGKRYLDGKRQRFDAEAQAALKAFQADHDLKADGRYGHRSARALARATAAEKRRRVAAHERRAAEPAREPVTVGASAGKPRRDAAPAGRSSAKPRREPAPTGGSAGKPRRDSKPAGGPARSKPADRSARREPAPAVTSEQLLAGLERLDARGDRLRAALLARHRALERALARARALSPGELDDLATLLGRLDVVVDEVQGAITAAKEPAEPPPPVVKVGGAIVTQATPESTGAVPVEPVAKPDLSGIDELTERLVSLNAEEDGVRALLAERFADLERKVARERARTGRVQREPATSGGRGGSATTGGGRRGSTTTRGEGGGRRGGATTGRDRGTAGGGRRGGRHASDDGRAGAAATLGPDSRSFRVRQSKVALARYLRRQRRETTRQLRRTLLREVRTPKTSKVATPAWERAVREAQGIAKLPVTGRLDPQLTQVLRRDWPTEPAMRKLVRGTPAWRLIPGQLSRNFNLREFACHDGTPYIAGLMREQGLSKEQATQRAKQLADRLERLRAREGNRTIHLNSVFRTRAHNAKVGGVKNSAHTRGYAADIRPPAGVSIAAHRAHVRKVFEGGCGLYATFVHGDFAPEEHGQNWTG